MTRVTLKESLPFDLGRALLLDAPGCLEPSHESLINGLIRARDFRRLAGIFGEFGGAYHTPEPIRLIRQIAALFSKNAQFAVREACEKAAVTSFLHGERLCRITNRRLEFYELFPERMDAGLHKQFVRAMNFVQRTLGPVKAFLDSIPSGVRLTSGATENSPRHRSMPFLKLKGPARMPRESYAFATSLATHMGVTPPRHIEVSRNRLALVPKNWKTHRMIACEPSGLLPFQLAFDAFIKGRLKRLHGIDLSNQDLNKDMARLASVFDNWATIDLKMASDTLSIALVKWLVTSEWWDVLKRLRSPNWVSDGRAGVYAKFSSMGNGCTFGLETLIFAACSHAVGSKSLCVYGDDIVIESERADDLVALLRFVGFRTNIDKSFINGPFKESCGGDFVCGVDVTPHYLKELPKHGTELCHLVNGLSSVTAPGGAVWTQLRGLVREHGLPVVAFVQDSLAGVWVDASTAWDHRLLKMVRSIPTHVQYRVESRQLSLRGTRPLEHWLLQRRRRNGIRLDSRQTMPDGVVDPLVTSRCDSGSQRVRLRRTGWITPTCAVPPHLWVWGTWLFA